MKIQSDEKKYKSYFISGDEMKVMVQLLKIVAKKNVLTQEQMESLSFDPYDIVNDLEDVEILGANVFYQEKTK